MILETLAYHPKWWNIASYLQGLGGGGVKMKEKGVSNPSLPTESSGLTFLTFPTPLL